MDDSFSDIRPYRDHELRKKVQHLLKDAEFRHAWHDLCLRIAKYELPARALSTFGRGLLGLATWVPKLPTVRNLQRAEFWYIRHLVKATIDELSYSGIEQLANDGKGYLFISNHKDIITDPMLINYGLYMNGFETAELGIGSNLLSRRWIANIVRLNKAYVVKRDLFSKEKLHEAEHLSQYIWTRRQQGKNMWLAQREGRSKDGEDRTQQAIIKMLTLAQRQTDSFPDIIRELRIVPVTLSYEYLPCDGMMAHELYIKEKSNGKYRKSEGEDRRSMTLSVKGYKGRVHVAFGEPLDGHFQDEEEVALTLDDRIQRQYILWPSNLSAHRKLQGIPVTEDAFLKRLHSHPAHLHDYILAMYARSVENKQHLQTTSISVTD
ncbi:MAG: cytochrome C oxidase Cbb3 [archaeon]